MMAYCLDWGEPGVGPAANEAPLHWAPTAIYILPGRALGAGVAQFQEVYGGLVVELL